MPTAIIDFETTGLSPLQGDRATEVAICLVEGERIVDRFQSLMNAGVYINSFIEHYTGITNEMIADAPPAEQVMADAARFVGDAPMVAHNASFDRRFWSAELSRLGIHGGNPYACTMLLSRRLYPEAGSFRLGSLAGFHSLPDTGRAHRAMADAETAAHLWLRIRRDLERRWDVYEPPHEFLVKLQGCQKKAVPEAIRRYLAQVGEQEGAASGPAAQPSAMVS